MYSVLILTLNEERDLPRCLASVRGCDDIVVLDSGSTDRTVALARAAGARVFARPFDNFAGQRNHAQREIPFRHRWVFHLDADEQMTPALDAECQSVAGRADVDGFFVAPRMMFAGRWIPRCTDYPAYQARFVRAPGFTFIEVGHGQREAPQMRLDRLRSSYLHDLSSGGDEEWLARHRRYARAEAAQHLASAGAVPWADLWAKDPLRRRRALKHLSFSFPGRPALRFVYQYLLRRGFLDGRAGLHYCRLLARYEGFIVDELRRLRQSGTDGMRVFFLNRFYWPDEPATAQLLTDLAEALAAQGHAVSVITRRPRTAGVPRREMRRGVEILRVGVTHWGRRSLAGRLADFATFFIGALWRLWRNVRPGDAVVVLTDPPMLGAAAAPLVRWRRAKLLHWVQDIYPEIAMELTGHRWLRMMRPLRNRSWRQARACVTVGTDMAAVLGAARVSPERILVSPNWAPAGLAPASSETVETLRTAWGLHGQFVVAYSGNLGRVHDLDPLLEIAAALRDHAHIAFVFIGDGARRAALEQAARSRGLTRVHFHPAQPRALLAATLSLGDVHFVTLLPGCERLVFPSKIYGAAAVARPVLFIGPRDCEPARLVHRHQFGAAFTRGETAAAARWIADLASDAARTRALGGAALAFSRDGAAHAARLWHELLAGLAGPARAA